MIYKIQFAQGSFQDENFNKIQKMITHISIMKQRESYGQINKDKLLKQTKELKKLINSTFSNSTT